MAAQNKMKRKAMVGLDHWGPEKHASTYLASLAWAVAGPRF